MPRILYKYLDIVGAKCMIGNQNLQFTNASQLNDPFDCHPKPGVGSSSLSSRANIIEMKKVIAYIKESYDELVHKVSWPTYSELANSAVVVLYASLLIALVVWGMDVCFQNFMEKIVYPH